MKKAVSSFCIVAVILLATVGSLTFASAGTVEEECDLVFRQALEEIVENEGVTAPTINVQKKPLYDVRLELLGFAYCMEYDGQEGYAVVVNTDDTFRVSEFYMSAQVPFDDREGMWIYLQPFSYVVFDNGVYIDPQTDKIIDENTIETLAEKAFRASGTLTTGSTTITYANRSVDSVALAKRHPCYFPVGENLKNACAPAAGANIIGYWTRNYPDLIPGFTPGSVQLGFYMYKESAAESYAVIESLYSLMGTGANGTTIDGFKKGMTSYVEAKSLTADYVNTFIFDTFDYSVAQQLLKSGIPLALFVDGFEVISYNSISDTQTSYQYMDAAGAHAMAGFGYQDVTYTFADGSTRTDSFIQVATGMGEMLKGYYNVHYKTQIDDCFGVFIH